MDDAQIAAFRDIGRKIQASNGTHSNGEVVEIGIGMLAAPFLREAIKNAVTAQETVVRIKATGGDAAAKLAELSNLTILGRHPRKGDRGWGLASKPLQGRRYRQACREWDRLRRSYRRDA